MRHSIIHRLFLFVIVFNVHLSGRAQTDSLNRKNDTTYIEKFPDKVIVKLDVDNDYDRYELSGNDFKYDIRPNASLSKLLSFNYRFFYVAFSYLPAVINKNKWDERRGKTTGYGFGTGLTTDHWLLNIEYKNVNGHYLYNTKDYVSPWDEDKDPYIQFPYLKTWMIRGLTLYKFNPKYSVRAIQTQTEAQRRSASSFIPGIAYNYYVIDNPDPNASSSQRSRNLEVLAQLNYYGTLVLKKRFYLSGGVGFAVGGYYTWLLTRYPTGEVESTLSDRILRGLVNLGLGYNGEKFISGAELMSYKSFSQQEKGAVNMVYTRTAYQVFIGYRIKPARIVVKETDKVEKFIKLKF
jgi:hypothetical protein